MQKAGALSRAGTTFHSTNCELAAQISRAQALARVEKLCGLLDTFATALRMQLLLLLLYLQAPEQSLELQLPLL